MLEKVSGVLIVVCEEYNSQGEMLGDGLYCYGCKNSNEQSHHFRDTGIFLQNLATENLILELMMTI